MLLGGRPVWSELCNLQEGD